MLMDQDTETSKRRKLRKRLGQFLRDIKYFLLDSLSDLFWMLAIGGAALGLYSISYQPPLLVRIYTTADRRLYNDAISYPFLTPIFSSLVAGLVCSLIPFGIILFAQIWVRSFADGSAAIMGLFYSLLTGTFFQVLLKKFVGGIRPHYLAVCQPELPAQGLGFDGALYPAAQICSGNPARILYALQSFPSGHSEVAFAGFGFLAIYLYTHLRIGDHRKSDRLGFWRMLLVLMPIMLATYISATLVLAYHHYVLDCVFGAAIGILTALLGYRLAFRSLICSRTNCEPRVGKRLKRDMGNRKQKAERSPQIPAMDWSRDLELGSVTTHPRTVSGSHTRVRQPIYSTIDSVMHSNDA
ncbi:phosphatidic acid phosphatase type 2/haloperoxidase [Exophiala viscosa]|nr:phosphatidic acid phosphatase type 2/haloperoxidase [Exophiala viscosa]